MEPKRFVFFILIPVVVILVFGVCRFVLRNEVPTDNFFLNQQKTAAGHKDNNLQSEPDTGEVTQADNSSNNITDSALQLPAEATSATMNYKDPSDDLPLPAPPSLDMPDHIVEYGTRATLLFNKQDDLYRDRVSYQEIASNTQALLRSQFGDVLQEEKVVPELVHYAHEQLKGYWAAGGPDSNHAYKMCYAAQAAIELALTLSPTELMLYEDLAEIICAAHPLTGVAFQKGQSQRSTNLDIVKQLIDIRTKQLDLYEKSDKIWVQVEDGINPVFKTLMELVYLHQLAGDKGGAAQIEDKAVALANKGGWDHLSTILDSHAQELRMDGSNVFPPEIQLISLKQRFGDLMQAGLMQQPGWRDKFFRLSSKYLRRGPFFEGPLYLKRVAKNENGNIN